MPLSYYIAACVYSARFPARSTAILRYAQSRGAAPVRCCVPNYRSDRFAADLAEPARSAWLSLPDHADLSPGDTVYSLCHNCSNILEEIAPDVRLLSLWELILSDPAFSYPDLRGKTFAVQDCWRAKDREEEKQAVREILRRCGAALIESAPPEDFCGVSLYRAQPPRNPAIAPRHYANQPGKFLPHSPAEQEAIMRTHCAHFSCPVVCYCHYCLEGLVLGGADARHLADLLFPLC